MSKFKSYVKYLCNDYYPINLSGFYVNYNFEITNLANILNPIIVEHYLKGKKYILVCLRSEDQWSLSYQNAPIDYKNLKNIFLNMMVYDPYNNIKTKTMHVSSGYGAVFIYIIIQKIDDKDDQHLLEI